MTASKWRVKSCGDGVALTLAFSRQNAGSTWLRASLVTMAASNALTDVVANANGSKAMESAGTGEAGGDGNANPVRIPETC